MKFYKVSSPEPLAGIIAEKILRHLENGEKVLWLITGGSAIKVETKTSKLLVDKNLDNLAVILMDERYGPVGHEDSNWHQLEEAGFKLYGATLIPILKGKDRNDSTQELGENLAKYFGWADYSIGQFGIGPDGHTAGILPESPHIETKELAISYADDEATQNFTEGVYRDKDRITMTSAAIARLDEVVVIALGKAPKLFDELEENVPMAKMPAQSLKQVSNFSIYNDYKGEQI